jgi:hypothetical protein
LGILGIKQNQHPSHENVEEVTNDRRLEVQRTEEHNPTVLDQHESVQVNFPVEQIRLVARSDQISL